jgi:starch synthase
MPSLKYDGSDSVETIRAEKRSVLSRVLPNSSATASEPVIAFKARWDRQKGIGLVSSCVESILEQARFIFDTWGEPRDVSAPYYETWQELQALSHKYPMHFAINVPGTTSPIESAALYTAADFLLMASVYEPCGLAQMECQRYGCVPIVRSTGGLADTVTHLSNGVVFHTMTSTGLLRGIGDAVDAYADDQMMARLIGETLRQRNEWHHRVGKYVSLYQDVRNWRVANGIQRTRCTASHASIYTDVTCWKKLRILIGSVKNQVAKIVHCGLPQDSFEALVPCMPNYCAREIWKKLSISVVGVMRK